MKKPLRSYILVEAVLDENDVPYLVADCRATSRRVGVERVHPVPTSPDHFAEHFKPRAHAVDVTDVLHLAHYRMEADAGTLRIVGPVQAADPEEALTKLEALELAAAAAAAAAASSSTTPELQATAVDPAPVRLLEAATAPLEHTTPTPTPDPAAAPPRTE
jgi:hypothetical protein